jgi:hypothetical protein
MKITVMESKFYFFFLPKSMRDVDKKTYESLAGGESLAAKLIEFVEPLE